MRKACILAILPAVLALAGCHAARTTSRAHDRTEQAVPGGYADSAARSSYVDRRTSELIQQGLEPKKAAAQASLEWFSRAPIESDQPSGAEPKQRQAQADFVKARDAQREADGHQAGKINPRLLI